MAKDDKAQGWATTVDEQGREYLLNKKTGEIKGKGFGMIDKSILLDVQKLINKHPSAAQVLFYFASIANKQNEISMSQSELEEKSGFNRSKIQKAIAILKKTNFILIKKINGSNTYYINDRFFWQSSFADKQFKSSHTGKVNIG
jgi:hypothetical protein